MEATSAHVSHGSAWKRHYPHLFLSRIRGVHPPKAEFALHSHLLFPFLG